jgi:hypothetical protein
MDLMQSPEVRVFKMQRGQKAPSIFKYPLRRIQRQVAKV